MLVGFQHRRFRLGDNVAQRRVASHIRTQHRRIGEIADQRQQGGVAAGVKRRTDYDVITCAETMHQRCQRRMEQHKQAHAHLLAPCFQTR